MWGFSFGGKRERNIRHRLVLLGGDHPQRLGNLASQRHLEDGNGDLRLAPRSEHMFLL